MGVGYRLRQFWRTLVVKTDPRGLENALALLNPGQAELFSMLQPGEKDHALVMVHKLVEGGGAYNES